MATPPRTLIIAVFGGSATALPPKVCAAATRFGYEIASRAHIVLTGGEGAACDTVKNCAIAGAEQISYAGATVTWLGIPKTPDPRAPARSTSGHGLVLYPGYGHSRNYVEARLCDAAIALPGGQGTGSEVAFCLVLGRPVILLGPQWRARYDLSSASRAASLSHFRDDVIHRVQSAKPAPPWQLEVDSACERLVAGDLELPSVEYRPTPDDDDRAVDIVDLAISLLDK